MVYPVIQLLINKLVLTINFTERNDVKVSMQAVYFESLPVVIKALSCRENNLTCLLQIKL